MSIITVKGITAGMHNTGWRGPAPSVDRDGNWTVVLYFEEIFEYLKYFIAFFSFFYTLVE